jgi:hypothetical protein
VLHVLGWVVVGLAVAVGSAVLPPRPRVIDPLPALLSGVAGAMVGGFVSWIIWDFPGNVITASDLLTTPALVSDCLAAFGALAALSVAMGVAMRANRSKP